MRRRDSRTARCSRLGAASSASMDRLMSTAKTRLSARDSVWISVRPQRGPASATTAARPTKPITSGAHAPRDRARRPSAGDQRRASRIRRRRPSHAANPRRQPEDRREEEEQRDVEGHGTRTTSVLPRSSSSASAASPSSTSGRVASSYLV